MGDRTDEELVRAIREGDEGASRALFERYRPRLRTEARRILRGIVRRRVAESDVMQEAYLAAFCSLDEFEDRGPGSFARWLQQILRHKARDQVRRHFGAAKRGAAVEVSHDAGDRPDPAGRLPTASRVALGRESEAEVRRAMATLPDEYRTVLDCVHRGGMTLAEVGEATGRSANAVCKVYGRAVRALAKALHRPPEA